MFKPKKYLSLDLETTGLDSTIHEIVQIGAVYWELNFNASTNLFEGKVIAKFSSLVKPVFVNNISREAMRINMLSKADLDKAPNSHGVRADFIEWWENVLGGEKTLLMGCNLGGFDKGFLKVLLKHFYDKMFDYHAVDVWSDAELCQQLGLIPEDIQLSLEPLCDYFDNVRMSHSAINDALAVMELRVKILNLLRGARK